MTFFGQFHRHRFDAAGDERLVAEQIISAPHHHYGDAKTRMRAARRMPRALPVLVREYTRSFDATLCLAESIFGITIALESTAQSHLQRVLWPTAHLHEDLYGSISTVKKQQVMTRLERLLDHWDTAGALGSRSKKVIADADAKRIKTFFAAEGLHHGKGK
jgi:hypothetical protein